MRPQKVSNKVSNDSRCIYHSTLRFARASGAAGAPQHQRVNIQHCALLLYGVINDEVRVMLFIILIRTLLLNFTQS